jgi:hypothetical protein
MGHQELEPEIVSTFTKRVIRARITEAQLRKVFDIPATAVITFHVPGGGDYSNMDLEVEELVVTWAEEERT